MIYGPEHLLLERKVTSLQFSIKELKHLGPRVQKEVLNALTTRTSNERKCNDVQRSEAAMVLSHVCLELMGGKSQNEAIEWLELAANLGHPVGKSIIYRVSKALDYYQHRESMVLSHLVQSAEDDILMVIEDLLQADEGKGEIVLPKLKQRRHARCTTFQPRRWNCKLILLRRSSSIPLDFGLSASLGALNIADEFGDNIFHQAPRCGDVPIIRRLLEIHGKEQHPLLNSSNNMGQTPLLLSCMVGEPLVAHTLLEAGANPAIADKAGDTPLNWLHEFDQSSRTGILASLIKQGADIHAISERFAQDDFSQKILARGTPLHRAAALNDGEAVSLLLSLGSDPLRPYTGKGAHELSTPLWLACTFHNAAVVEAILLHLNKTRDLASILNDEPRKQWPFLKPVLDSNYHHLNGGMMGRMTRHGAQYRQATYDTLKVLKQHGASIRLPSLKHRPNRQGFSALNLAISLRCIDIVHSVLEICPEQIEQWDPQRMQPPLHSAAQQDRADIVQLLLSKGASPRSRCTNGLNALAAHANYQSDLEVPQLLISLRLQYEIPTNGFQTPFFAAVVNNSFELAAFILEHTPARERDKILNSPCSRGLSWSSPKSGITVLGYLLSVCHQSCIRVINRLFNLADKFDVSVDFVVDSEQGYTALHVLTMVEPPHRTDTVVAAAARGVSSHYTPEEISVDHIARDGQSALWHTVRNLNYDLVEYLLGAGADPHMCDGESQSALKLLRHFVEHLHGQHKGEHEHLHLKIAEEQAGELIKGLDVLFKEYGYDLSLEG